MVHPVLIFALNYTWTNILQYTVYCKKNQQISAQFFLMITTCISLSTEKCEPARFYEKIAFKVTVIWSENWNLTVILETLFKNNVIQNGNLSIVEASTTSMSELCSLTVPAPKGWEWMRWQKKKTKQKKHQQLKNKCFQTSLCPRQKNHIRSQ